MWNLGRWVAQVQQRGPLCKSPSAHFTNFCACATPSPTPSTRISAYPYLLILPVRTAMGPDPEARRRDAPRHSRSSISTREDEFRLTGTEDPYYCDPLTVVIEFQQPPTANSEPTGIWLDGDWFYARCTTDLALDADQDGINDDCEYVIAHTFRPVLKVSHHNNNLGRESYWAVAKGSLPESFKVFYALAYYRDGGTDNVGFGGHLGNSEFIVLTASHLTTYTINSTVSKWLLEGGFLSAHWDHGMFDSSGGYGYSWFEYPAEYRGRPRIWVAEEKHANYRKQSVCDDGALWGRYVRPERRRAGSTSSVRREHWEQLASGMYLFRIAAAVILLALGGLHTRAGAQEPTGTGSGVAASADSTARADTLDAERGRSDGRALAARTPVESAWIKRGTWAGVLAVPAAPAVGISTRSPAAVTIVALGPPLASLASARFSRVAMSPEQEMTLAGASPAYAAAYRSAYAEGVRGRRIKRTAVGVLRGAVVSGAAVYVVFLIGYAGAS